MNEDVQNNKLAIRLKELGLKDLIHPPIHQRHFLLHLIEIIVEPQLIQFGATHPKKLLVQAMNRLMEVIHLHCQMDIDSFGL